MLIRMMPEQVVKQWHEIVPYLEASLPEEERTQEVVNRVLEKAMSGKVHVWLSYNSEDYNSVNAVAFTAIVFDSLTGTKNLLLYAVTRVIEMDEETTAKMWAEGWQAVAKFGAGLKCSSVVAFTDLDYIVEVAGRFGGSARQYITIPIGGQNETKS